MNQESPQDELADLEISFTLNDSQVRVSIKPWETALDTLRNKFGLTGVKEGCGIGECGACTIVMDGKAVNGCLVLAAQLDGRIVETVEGLSSNGTMNYLQKAFLDKGGVQCGFCTPGMLMSAKALLDECDQPSKDMITNALSGNLCRCAGYVQLIDAVEEAARIKPKDAEDKAVNR
jgi:carbon-monoxide dehydrogenase small subunit